MAPPDDQAEAVTSPSIWQVRVIAAIAFTVIALIASARADSLTEQLAGEAASIDQALATVTQKVGEADHVRARRLAAAYRVLQTPGEDAMATVRRRAAARMLIERDIAERTILADEAAQLRAAATRTAADAARVPSLVMPTSIGRPASGTIARHFGTLQHERSKATLARRGIDIEVESRATVVAPGAGIVRYAGPIRGLDSGIILDHGSYLTVIAKLGEVVVPVGAPIARGDRIGRAARHRVYLELRVKLGPGGHPIDPEPLLESPKRTPTR
ncbi:MAG: M23 family metallopeptidase [Kofleriaceae bacterium]